MSARLMPCTLSRSVSSWYWPDPGAPDEMLLPFKSRTLLMLKSARVISCTVSG